MPNVAEMRVIVGDRERAERAEELRILEALLFAAEEPLDEKTLAARLPAEIDLRGAACAIAEGLCVARREPRCVLPANGHCAPRATSPGC